MWTAIATIIPVLIIGIFITYILNKFHHKIDKLKYNDFEIDFTDLEHIKKEGESSSVEKFRMLLLKQLLFTQEFVNRFQPLISTFIEIGKKYDETSKENDDNKKYPSLKYTNESLSRFRDLLRNSHFKYVINWDCPIYDKVNSGYREEFIKNLGYKSKTKMNPNVVEDCKIEAPSIDYKEEAIFKDYESTRTDFEDLKSDMYSRSKKKEDFAEEDIVEVKSSLESQFDRFEHLLEKIDIYMHDLKEKSEVLDLRLDYSMDIANSMYESLLYWEEKIPRIVQAETSSILYIIYEHLSLWLIRNDLPLSQVNLEQYLNTHTQNLVAKINEDVVKHMPRYNYGMWEEALKKINISDTNINNYFKNEVKEWIIGVQQVRFGVNIFLGTEDFVK